jgi:hypothetical protein
MAKMHLYEIVNHSDPYTIEASSLDVAAMTAILLGQGQYRFKSLDGGEDVPLFFLGGGDVWAKKHFEEDLMEMSNRVMDTKLSQVADCLDSVLYGDAEARKEFLESTKDMDRPNFEATRAIRQNDMCSSSNDIGSLAYRMAAKLRKSIADGMKTLQ